MELELDDVLENNKDSEQKTLTAKLKKAVNEFLAQSKGYEEDRIALSKKSEVTAWKVAGGFGCIGFAALVAISVMMPLKEIKTVLIKVETTTGYTEVVGAIEDAREVTYGEVMDKYWIDKYIIERNSYEWELVQSSYDATKLMSSRNVFGAYNKYITGPNSPTEIYEDTKVIKINVQGVTFLPATSKTSSLAQIRFVRHIQNPTGDSSTGYKPTKWTATISYDYLAEIETEEDRKINPLAFRVTSYREDRIID